MQWRASLELSFWLGIDVEVAEDHDHPSKAGDEFIVVQLDPLPVDHGVPESPEAKKDSSPQ